MLRLIFSALFLAMMMTSTFSQQPSIEPGVPKPLAEWRAAHYSNVRYKLNLTLEKGTPLMKGAIEISVTLDEEGAKYPLVLDWRTTQFQSDKDKPLATVTEVNGRSMINSNETFIFERNEHIVIGRELLKKGENAIKITFSSPIKTSGAAVTRYIDKEDGAEYIYSLFVPSDASTAFPVFDQPDLKARFSLTVLSPQNWKVITNTSYEPLSPMLENDSTKSFKSQLKMVHQFQETKPISTYVFAFAAGDFAVVDCRGESCVRPMSEAKTSVDGNSIKVSDTRPSGQAPDPALQTNIYLRKSQTEKFKPHAPEIFRLNSESIKYLEEYFDYKFPFPKYDLVLIPEFPFGGMEHAGATFLRESSIIFPQEPTKNDLISRATLIFHENAHQWFGDTVTMKWFDDLWLKEGFATFAGFKALEKIMPEMNAWKAFYERNKVAAYQTDATKGTTPIYQEIPNLSAAKSAYGAIVYSKAPSFLKQAEFYLGEKEFQTAVRAFLKKHEFKNATWQDLVTEFGIAKREDLKEWGNNWVTKRGLPIVRATKKPLAQPEISTIGANYPNDTVYLTQSDALAENGIWQMKSQVLIGYNETRKSVLKAFRIDDNSSKNVFRSGNEIPASQYVFPNYQDYGYGIFLLDEKSRDYILANVQNEKDDFLRSMMYGSLWDSVREAELDPIAYVELVIKNVAVEKDETIVSSMLGRANTAINYYLDNRTRESLAPKLEEILIGKMQAAETLGQRITFYRSFLNVASSEKARGVLKEILSGKFKIKDLTLKTKDKFDIVTKLFVLGDQDAETLLGELVKTETGDDAKRYAYAARAGIATAENKAKFWNDFVNNKEISESWIEAAFGPFNSIRHSELTLPYLEKALAELPSHKRNRKIFFVNGWLGAFIGGQKDEKALGTVNKFLADNPQIDRDLRLKILENVDLIERAVRIRQKFNR
jgi:aminopeptidase N